MTLREATINDAPAIAALVGELGYDASVEAVTERLKRMLARLDHRVCVVVVGADVAGWVQAHASDSLESGARVEIVGLVVTSRYQRRGIGRLLVDEVERWSATLGIPSIVVRSNVERQASHTFYPALGFPLVKTQAVYRKRLSKKPNKSPEPTP